MRGGGLDCCRGHPNVTLSCPPQGTETCSGSGKQHPEGRSPRASAVLRVSAGPSAVLASTPSSTRTPRSRRPPRPRTLVRCFADGRCAAARRSQLHASFHGIWHPDGAFCLHLLQAQPPVPLAAVRVRRRHPAIDACRRITAKPRSRQLVPRPDYLIGYRGGVVCIEM